MGCFRWPSQTLTKAAMCVVLLHLGVNSEQSRAVMALQICPDDVKNAELLRMLS